MVFPHAYARRLRRTRQDSSPNIRIDYEFSCINVISYEALRDRRSITRFCAGGVATNVGANRSVLELSLLLEAALESIALASVVRKRFDELFTHIAFFGQTCKREFIASHLEMGLRQFGER